MAGISVEELQAALQAAQEQESTARLSERNVVELISKLQELDLLGEDLLHSINGREYLTKRHLQQEIADTVLQSGGRVALVELPALLGVDLVHCERAAGQVLADSKDLLNLNGELVTSAHLDSLASEANQLLQEAGVLALGELARRYKLSMELVQDIMQQRLGTLVHGRLHSGLIFTSAYVGRTKCQLRGALRGALRPVPTQHVLRMLDLPASGQGAPIAALVQELIQEKALQGSLKASGSVWVPYAYSHAQQGAVVAFYHQNQYIGYDLLAKMGISGDPLEYVYPLLPDGFALASCFVDPALLEQVEAAADEALADSSWVDVHPLLPAALTAQDAALLLAECPTVEALSAGGGKTPEGQVLAGTCLVSMDLLIELRDKACAEARSLADTALQERRAMAAHASPSASEAAASAGQGMPPPAEPAGDSDEDWSASRKGGSHKKKAPKRRGAAPSKTKAHASSSSEKQKDADAGAAKHRQRLSPAALAVLVVEWVPEMEGAGEDEGLPAAVADELRGPAHAAFDEALEAVFTAGAEARRRAREACQAALDSDWARLQAHAQGARGLAAALRATDEAACAAIERHTVRVHALRAVDLLLRLLQVDGEEEVSEGPGARGGMGASERVALLNQLPAHLGPPARQAVDRANGADLQAAQAALEALADAAGTRLRKPDRKAGRAAVASHTQALGAELARESDPAAALSLAVPLLVAQILGHAVSIPGKAIGPVLGLLQKQLSEQDQEVLASFHKLVVKSLTSDYAEESGGAEALHQTLKDQLPAVKAVAGIKAEPPAA